ncbi:MAG: hypothetical protein QOJ63_843 [Solirubrobacteraceae bacterium]|jgi:hypothetical protein|nr:hypothetical protein [Solirubrobacteraceae bacterium]
MSAARTSAQSSAMEALIEAHATELKLPTVKARFRQMAAEATREQQTPTAYLAALLEAETAQRAERREKRRLIDARFPQIKRLEEFRFADNHKIPQATIAALAEGSWIDDRESIILIGDSGTGKTHLATALAVCACQAGRRVRFTTLAGLANELQEADSRRELARVVGRYSRRVKPGCWSQYVTPLLPHAKQPVSIGRRATGRLMVSELYATSLAPSSSSAPITRRRRCTRFCSATASASTTSVLRPVTLACS